MSGQMEIETEIDIDKCTAISRSLEKYLSKQFSVKMHQVIDRKDIRLSVRLSECELSATTKQYPPNRSLHRH